jgi:hypothetical protein
LVGVSRQNINRVRPIADNVLILDEKFLKNVREMQESDIKVE